MSVKLVKSFNLIPPPSSHVYIKSTYIISNAEGFFCKTAIPSLADNDNSAKESLKSLNVWFKMFALAAIPNSSQENATFCYQGTYYAFPVSSFSVNSFYFIFL